MASEEEPISKFTDEQLINNILKALQEQREICRFCDVILKVCGEEIFAHSNVLAAASPYFASFLGTLQDLPRAFSQKLPQVIEIHIEGSSESKIGYGVAVRKLVDFMYTSCIQITPSVITQVSEIAKIMELETIVEICEKFRNGQSKTITVSASGGELSTPTTIDEEDASGLKLDDHAYGIHDVDAFTNPEEENVNKDQMTQTQLANTSVSSVDSQNEDTKPSGDDDLNVTPPSPVEASGTNNAQTLAESIDPLLLDETETGTSPIITDEVPGVADKKEASTDPDDTVTESEPLISAPLERSTPTADTESEPVEMEGVVTPKNEEKASSDSIEEGYSRKEGSAPLERSTPTADTESEPVEMADVATPKNEEKASSDSIEEGYSTKEGSDQCSGAVRSSLRIRLCKKNAKDRHYHRKKVKVKSRIATTTNNNNNNTSNNNNINEQTQNNGSTKDVTEVIEVYICDECLYSTCNYNHYKRHKKIHQDGKYSCNKCDYKANRLKSLNNHKRIHLHAELQCSYCKYKATNTEDLTVHLSRHSGEHPYFCSVCDMKFKTRTQLSQHTPKHSDEKPFVCPKCFAGFKWKHALKSHMVVHSENKDYLCDICGYVTAHKSQLKTHHLIHTGETFKCSIEGCTFQALKRLNLKYHMLTHTNEKPHVCSVCNQNFSLIKNLRRHMLLHTDNRPYTCEHCSFKSTRYDKLKEHLLKQHNIGERPGKRQRICDYQVSGEKLMQEPTEEIDESTLQTIVVTENATDTISGTTTQIVIAAADNLPVPIAITRVNSEGYTEIAYPTFQYM